MEDSAIGVAEEPRRNVRREANRQGMRDCRHRYPRECRGAEGYGQASTTVAGEEDRGRQVKETRSA